MADHGSYTVKGLPSQARETLVRCARQAGDTQAVWLARAIQNEADRQGGALVILPSEREADRVPPPQLPAAPEVDLLKLTQACASVMSAGGASKALNREVNAMLRDELRKARGLPAVEPAPTARQTNGRFGQTVNEAGLAVKPG